MSSRGRRSAQAVVAAAMWMCAAGGQAAVVAPAPDGADAAPSAHAHNLAADPAVSPLWRGEDLFERLADIHEHQAREAGEPNSGAPARRRRLLAEIAAANACFIGNPTPEQLEAIIQLYQGRNPSERMTGRFGNRFQLQDSQYNGSGQVVSPTTGLGRAIPRLTFSFPDDGTPWGTDLVGDPQVNQLNANFGLLIGMGDPNLGPEIGQELVRQTFAAAEYYSGIRYEQVCDDNAPISLDPVVSGFHGEIRIGAVPLGTGIGILAFNFYPEAGGDMVLNSSYFTDVQLYLQPSGGHRLLRNAIAHEHGHGLGFRHVVPCSQSKLMEPFSSTVYDMWQVDERRALQYNYGDRYAGNHSSATAHDLGLIHVIDPMNPAPPADPRYPSTGANFRQSIPIDREDPALNLMPTSVIERELSIAPIDHDADPMTPRIVSEDWFKFTIEHQRSLLVRVDPTGLIYASGPQTDPDNPCTLTDIQLDAERAQDLNFELYRDDGMGNLVLVHRADEGEAGEIEEFTSPSFSAATYYIRVYSASNNITPQEVQLYDLWVQIADTATPTAYFPARPTAVAGVDRLAGYNRPIKFAGDVSSRANSPGISVVLRTQDYEWDLDGDGVFEINIDDFNPPPPATPVNPRAPQWTYVSDPMDPNRPSNRILPVTLRVTDRNGRWALDTIYVRFVGDPILISGANPAAGAAGTTLAVTLTGTGLGAVVDPARISFGPGITVNAITAAAADGTSLTVEIAIDPVTPGGPRDIAVTDGCSIGLLPGGFAVDSMAGACCEPNNTCLITAPTTCLAPNAFLGAGTVCLPTNPCNNTAGACCSFSGGCMVTADQATCEATPGSTFQGIGVMCAPASCEELGACCNNFTGACVVTTAATCPSSSTFNASIMCMPGFCPPPPTGACCFPAGCMALTELECNDMGGSYQGNSVACDPEPCPGRCCLPDGTCIAMTTLDQCATGVFTVGQTSCAPNPCPQPLGSCCDVFGDCTQTTSANCASTSVWSMGETCTPNPCVPPMGACCAVDGACTATDVFGCSGDWTAGEACMPNPCPQPPIGACCDTNGNCTATTAAACFGNFNPFAMCLPTNPCPQPFGACCNLTTGVCTFVRPVTCSAISGTFQGGHTTCTPGLCAPVTGACCAATCISNSTQAQCDLIPGGTFFPGLTCSAPLCGPTGACCFGTTCQFLPASSCVLNGGSFRGDGTACTPNPCLIAATGACCSGTTCSITTEAVCGGAYQGDNTACGPSGNPTTCCPANVDGVGGLTTDDLFIYLSWYVGGDTRADFNGVDGVTSDDLNQFLVAYFSGCNQPVGACCAPDGTCTIRIQVACLDTYQGDGTTCVPNTCPVTMTGACCNGTTCTITTQAGCTGAYQGDGVQCDPDPGNPTTCCPANFDGVGGVDVSDIFAFLDQYHLGDPSADFNGDGIVEASDIFAFLDAFFAGC